MPTEWISALIGGVIIGIAVSLMLLWNGRVAGISGIIYGVINRASGDWMWRLFFLGGIFAGGISLWLLRPESFGTHEAALNWKIPVAGLLVGFGTILGSGCTSGHGVCGNSRLSPRSLVATFFFMLSGIGIVFITRAWGGLL